MPDLTRRRKMLVLAICCMSLLMASMDNTIVNVALPSIRKDFNASASSLQWTIDSYTLVLASLLMLSGSTADRLGRRRVFVAGLVLFSLGSLLCSVADSVALLVTFRMVQAVGGSMLNPVAMSIITNVFTEPKERARAIGVWSAVVGVALGIGPVLGGLLTETVGWRAIFWINVPIGIAAIVLCRAFVPESRAARARRVDPVGQLLVIGFMGSLTYGIIEGARTAWTDGPILACAGIAVGSLLGLIGYERRRVDPLIDLRFFSSVPFSAATVTAVCTFSSFSGFLFLNTLYLQEVRGLSALHAGLYTLPLAVTAMVVSPLSGRLVAARGARLPLLISGAGVGLGSVMLTRLSASTSVAYLFTAYALFGLGFAMANSPITNSAVSGMPRSQAGVAAGVASTSRQLGATLGVAIVGAIAGASTAAAGRSHAAGAAFTTAIHPAWWLLTGAGVLVAALGLASTGEWARSTATETARRIDEVPQPGLHPVPA